MSYHHCRNGHCGDCNGYIGPLDTYVCLCSHHRKGDPRAGYVCSQDPHPGAEFYGPGGGCAECGHKP